MIPRTFIFLALLAACARGDAHDHAAHAAPAAPAPAAAPAPSDPADWCAEHGVPESKCTLCHPDLIPKFQAAGDWCASHGLPESVCPICNPAAAREAAARAGAVLPSADGAPADGTRIKVRGEGARVAGIATAPAVEAPSTDEIVVPARLRWDAARVADVGARAAGVVREVRADLGQAVEAGAPLAILESAEAGADRGRLRAAKARLDLALAARDRVGELHRSGVASRREVQEAGREVEEARAEADAAGGAVGLVGRDAGGRHVVASPLAGAVTKVDVAPGRLVAPGQVLFQVVDPTVLWADLSLPEAEAARVLAGQAVELTFPALAGRTFTGTVDHVAPEVDATTRTVVARVRLPNPVGRLRANLLGEARVRVPAPGRAASVPGAAVQRAGDTSVVFVRTGEGAYEVRRVTPGPRTGDLVAVEGRLRPGEEVVTDGAYLLKTETRKDRIGAGCCDVEQE